MIKSSRNAAGNPPKFDNIFTPSTPPVKLTMTHATIPTAVPHKIFSHLLPSGFSGEIPVDEMLAIADILESEEVTKQTNDANI